MQYRQTHAHSWVTLIRLTPIRPLDPSENSLRRAQVEQLSGQVAARDVSKLWRLLVYAADSH